MSQPSFTWVVVRVAVGALAPDGIHRVGMIRTKHPLERVEHRIKTLLSAGSSPVVCRSRAAFNAHASVSG